MNEPAPTESRTVGDLSVTPRSARLPYAHNDSFNRCQVCGRFFPMADIESGKATHKMITPDSDWSYEQWESLCVKHALPNKADMPSGLK